MYYEKTYDIDDLLDDDWEKRVDLIEKISIENKLVPYIRFEVTAKKLVYKQRYIRKDNSLGKLEELVELLEYFEAINFVHGDINRKNIITCNNSYYLIDFEPSLKQIKHNQETLIFTMPYISLNDFKTNELSIQTDKIGFYFFALRKFGLVNNKDIVKLKNKILKDQQLVSESILKQSYKDILKTIKCINKNLT